MRFRDFINEEREKHAVLAFGRMNPPTTGHELLINKVKEIAKQTNASHHIVLSQSQDKSKNPLTPTQKLFHAKRFFPDTNITVATQEAPTFLDQAKKLYGSGVTHLHMVSGSDRVQEYEKLLNKYNGTKADSLFNFKSIKVHSVGDRDPDAEGVSGISASKMRSYAISSNLKEFKKGIPTRVSEQQARELYNDVRRGMGIRENMDFTLPIDEEMQQLIYEGVHDKGIFKAVFLAGGPGSGKDYVLDDTLTGHGLIEINSDKALEFLMDKHNLDKTMPESEQEPRDFIRGRAKNVTELRQRLALFGRNGLIINGTGDDYEKYKKIKNLLGELGYETSMVSVIADDEVSRQRNIERGQRGGRTVPEKIRKAKWDAVTESRPKMAKLFSDNYIEFDNSEDLRKADPETVKAKKDEMLSIFKRIKSFVETPPSANVAKEWIAKEISKKDTLPIPKGDKGTTPTDSAAAIKAKQMGLTYYGFGRWGKNGMITHHSVHGELVVIQRKKQKEVSVPISGSSQTPQVISKKVFPMETKNLDKEFGNLLSEEQENQGEPRKTDAKKLLTLNKTFGVQLESNDLSSKNLLKDKNGKVRVFMLRSAAASEAHVRNGQVEKTKKGYVVKLKELKENANITNSNQSIQEETTNGNSGNFITESEGIGCAYGYGTKIFSEESTPEEKTTTEAKDHRAKDNTKEKIEESKEKPLEEMRGDQKEDELKIKGISLSTFKKKLCRITGEKK